MPVGARPASTYEGSTRSVVTALMSAPAPNAMTRPSHRGSVSRGTRATRSAPTSNADWPTAAQSPASNTPVFLHEPGVGRAVRDAAREQVVDVRVVVAELAQHGFGVLPVHGARAHRGGGLRESRRRATA